MSVQTIPTMPPGGVNEGFWSEGDQVAIPACNHEGEFRDVDDKVIQYPSGEEVYISGRIRRC
jgi:hypothetical protein